MADTSSESSPSSDRTTVRRGAKRAEYGQEKILEILRAGSVAHVGVKTNDGPLVLPMVYGLTDDTLYLHGALANSLLKSGADTDICVTVTIVDGLVFAKTPFNHSMNYRSVVVRGKARVVEDDEEVMRALRLMTDHIVQTWDVTRDPSPSEIRATRIVALPLDEKSAKVRTGEAINDEVDIDLAVWSGYIPISSVFGSPISNSDSGAEIPAEVLQVVGRDIHGTNEGYSSKK
jgi:nitroimidazol reductase NimA-like FMN-containing flavoprotein (pyridoxamine 5'-phosphate oxidase superfamily)